MFRQILFLMGSTLHIIEDSLPNPTSVYAQSKYEGEKIVNPPAGGQAMIVRIAYPYRS